MSALTNFIRISDALFEFNADICSEALCNSSVHSLDVHKEELKEIWQKVKSTYESSLKEISSSENEKSAIEVETIKAKYQSTYRTYVDCISKLSEGIESKRSQMSQTNPNTSSSRLDSHYLPNIHLPPCDTELFDGDYPSWPSFRDLFTAIYIKNPRLSPVEKLFHLSNKTRGEAKELVRKAPLTNEGFEIAWNALRIRFENKRLLINSQLKVLFHLRKIDTESSDSIKSIQSTINGIISALKLYKVDIESWDPIFIFLCCTNLPENTLGLWEHSLESKTDCPSWAEMDKFLTSRFQTLETVYDLSIHPSATTTSDKAENSKNQKSVSKNNIPKRVNSYQNLVSPPNCKLCPDQSHTIRLCPKFIGMTHAERLSFIKKYKLCLNCFSKGHSVKDCKSAFNCFKCQRRHNTLLHTNDRESENQTHSEQTPSISSSPATNLIQSCAATNSKAVLLGTAIVHIVHNDSIFPARALFDSGSEASFISERLFNLLKLDSSPISTQISGLNGIISARSQKICSLQISSPQNSDLSIDASVIVIPHLTSSLPTFVANKEMFANIPSIKLADPEFYRTSYIDILIGADLFPKVMLKGVISQVCGSLMAQETIFGWILTGPMTTNSLSSFQTRVSYFNEIALEKQLSKFWEVEDIPKKKFTSKEDQLCETNFNKTTKRDSTGRYIVTLPFKKEFPEVVQLGQSKGTALTQFLRNEARLIKTPKLKSAYADVLKEYLQLGHMKEVRSSVPISSETYYLPHHAVIRPESVTTKIRVVFNASCPTSNGISLNDVLYCGPPLQLDLTTLLLQWRFYKFVFNSDIEKMYRQIKVDPKHTPFQRIINRDSLNNIREYELTTVTFGLNCAPYLALRVIQKLAEEVKDIYPLASQILKSSMYVDDILAGSHDLPSAIQARKEVIAALSSAGFALRKWVSNSAEFLKSIPKEHLLNEEFLNFEDSSMTKTLGVKWNAKSDYFYFSSKTIQFCSNPTKKYILSEISKLFDPCGWLSPFIVLAKVLMRDLWASKIGWDDTIANKFIDTWRIFLQNYSDIGLIRIPRWIDYYPECHVQLHGFCDSSEKAYAAVIYMRIENPNGAIRIHLLTAKTKVAPLKTISIPRLELSGALLLAEAIDSFLPDIPIPNCPVFCWTDSMIVLAWLKKPAHNWKTFVANRVSKISEMTDIEKWAHVDSKQNPADIASRGAVPKELIDNNLWWHGPNWLKLPASLWPITINTNIAEDLLESKKIQSNFSYFSTSNNFIDRFSSLGKALRVLCYIYRFISRARKSNATFSSITLENSEILLARNKLIVMSQKHLYPNEYKCLTNKQLISSSSSLSNVNPFLDSNGIMRVGSRVANAEDLTYDEKFPIILPYHSLFSKLLLNFIHTITLHGGNNLMLRMLRLQFWIPKAKTLIRSVIHKCKVCVISKHKTQTQLMGILPTERTTFSRPFTNTGIDFAGPFEIKTYTGRSCIITKGYVCIFVCFTTRAIHLELTSSLSAPAFLAAFHRFVSRRGCPKNIYSDNGKTFVGASKDLAQSFLQGSREFVSINFSHQNLSWHFIPPGAPHMGGLWEAGVKSFKLHFRKIAGNHKFTFEEFSTMLARIEACLNSRPLSPDSENPNELLALTPGHFLVGTPLLSNVEPNESEKNLTIMNRWRRVKALSHIFAIRWKHEYLKELHKRVKWQRPQPNIQIGSMVVVKDDCLPPTQWRLGRVSKVYFGQDNLVRVVEIKTQKGVITRPVTKIVLLPPC